MIVCDQSILEHIASFAPRTEKPAAPRGTFDLDAFVSRHLGGTVTKEGPWNGGYRWELNPCPFNPDHTDRAAYIVRMADGAIGAGCWHDGCRSAGNDWHRLRDMFEPKSERQPTSIYKEERTPASTPGHSKPLEGVVVEAPAKPRLKTVDSMLDIEDELIQWLWYPWVPCGKLTLVEGDPGDGKTWLLDAIIAALTAGYPLPGTGPLEPRRVLLLAGEDGYGDTVKPRLRSLGADLSKVRPVLGLYIAEEETMMTLSPDGIAALDAEIEAYKPGLVVIDPLIAYLSASVDIHRSNEVRSVLRPVGDIAQRHGCAVVGIRHLTKASHSMALYRGQGSIDFTAISRSVLLVVRDKDDPSRRIVVPSKASLAPESDGQEFFLSRNRPGEEFTWGKSVEQTASHLLAAAEGGEAERSSVREAIDFLKEVLFDGTVHAKEVLKQAKEAGVSEITLRRAKTELKVKVRRQNLEGQPRGAGTWVWEMPAQDDTSDGTFKVIKENDHLERDHLERGAGNGFQAPKTDGPQAADAFKVITENNDHLERNRPYRDSDDRDELEF